jgi:hypothetical protein
MVHETKELDIEEPDATTEKQSLDLLFLSSPKIPAKFSQKKTTTGHNQLVPR